MFDARHLRKARSWLKWQKFGAAFRERVSQDGGAGLLHALAAAAGALCLFYVVAAFGFYLPGTWERALEGFPFWAAGFFVAHHFLSLILEWEGGAFLRRRAVLHALACAVAAEWVLSWQGVSLRRAWGAAPSDLAVFVLAFWQTGRACLCMLEGALHAKGVKQTWVQPARLSFITFGLLITLGACLLKLPRAAATEIGWLDALFMSTSAVCVTGLAVVDPGTAFTPLGQGILLGLIQAGGIGIMTLLLFGSAYLGGGRGLRDRLLIGNLVAEDRLNNAMRMLRHVIVATLAIELAGVAVLWWCWREALGERAVWFSVFHSVSAFCNAGFSLFSENLANPVARNNLPSLLMICALVILGGLGYPVLSNCWDWLKTRLLWRRRQGRARVTMNTRMVALATVVLLAAGTFAFSLLEYNGVFKGMGVAPWLAHSFFLSTVPRTAGFNTVDTGALTQAACLGVIALMMIGAAPVSTAGGIKITVFAVGIAYLVALAQGKARIRLFEREVDVDTLAKALGIIITYLVVMAAGVFLLTLTERGAPALDLLFEEVSALSTVGLSRNLTPNLSDAGKCVIIASMLIGRLGVLTFFWAIFYDPAEKPYRYPKENVILM